MCSEEYKVGQGLNSEAVANALKALEPLDVVN